MDETQRRVDTIRHRSSEMENHLIDTYRKGGIDRREFVRRGTVLGMSAGTIGFLASACGSGDEGGGGTTTSSEQQTQSVQKGGKVTAAINSPAGAIDPITVADDGSLAVLAQAGEYLVWSDSELNAVPRLAESWTPNEDASVWTFKIRQGVKFHDGKEMTSEDVAASINRLADPESASQALSAFTGFLTKDSAKATDATTVEFSLEAPNGSFPYLLSSDNYNTIILPADYDGDYEKNMNGTGPFILEKFTQGQSATFRKNPDYWGKERQPNPDTTEIRFYGKEQARVLALQSGEVDVVTQFSVSGGRALLTDPNVQTVDVKAATHRQVHLRTDQPPFTDKRVRQALALAIDRNGLVDGLFKGKAQLGNDSPFAPVFKYTDTSVAQRQQDIEQAKQLLADAGMPDGFEVQLDTWDGFEIPDLAQLIQNNAKEIGATIKLNITDAASYYGDSVYGKSTWLDSNMGITDYGHRGIVNVYLSAPLLSDGTWNSAHFRNKEYDKLVKDFVAQSDIDQQKQRAKEIQELLLDETPIIIPYFYDFLTGVRKGIAGVETTGMGHVQLTLAGQSA
jgi:peptide/nickel transport system substrate-binding protein